MSAALFAAKILGLLVGQPFVLAYGDDNVFIPETGLVTAAPSTLHAPGTVLVPDAEAMVCPPTYVPHAIRWCPTRCVGFILETPEAAKPRRLPNTQPMGFARSGCNDHPIPLPSGITGNTQAIRVVKLCWRFTICAFLCGAETSSVSCVSDLLLAPVLVFTHSCAFDVGVHIVTTDAAIDCACAIPRITRHQVAFWVAAFRTLTENVPVVVEERARSRAEIAVATVSRVVVSMVPVYMVITSLP